LCILRALNVIHKIPQTIIGPPSKPRRLHKVGLDRLRREFFDSIRDLVGY
jgi:hypothetical protein